jgi:hypothetical protein
MNKEVHSPVVTLLVTLDILINFPDYECTIDKQSAEFLWVQKVKGLKASGWLF